MGERRDGAVPRDLGVFEHAVTKPVNAQIYGPPQHAPLTNDAWRQWFTKVVWPLIGKGIENSGVQGTFPQLQVGNARFTRENEFQELINLDQGLYVNYTSSVQNIIYGFACNVRHSGSSAYTVGAQINAWGEVGSTGDVFGLATTSTAQPQSGVRNLIGYEPDIGSNCDANTGVKWGINPVFKNRGDGATNAADGLTSNYYNYMAEGMVFTSQARSALGEYCGWSTGIDFLDGWCDQASVPAWSSSATYGEGEIVSSGGVLWKAIVSNTNVTPAVGPTWVQRTYSGTNNLAVGIDFSSMSTTSMGRMASAIRLRSTQLVHWEETGAVGTSFNATTSVLGLCVNQSTVVFGMNVVSGTPVFHRGGVGPGGGAAATLPTVGGSGPTGAASTGWFPIVIADTSTVWIPVWQ